MSVKISTTAHWLVLAVMVLFHQGLGGAATIDFEGFPGGTALTTQYPGLTFINATVLTAGVGLNEFEFPPHSGTNTVFDDGGPMSISFATPILSFGAYFTYAEPLLLQARDATGTQVASTTSAFFSNMALSGDPGSAPNEFLGLNYASGIASITITGDAFGGSFVMDDVGATSAAPEPGSFILLSTIIPAFLWIARRRPSKH